MNNFYLIGLTGNIGSGKTTVRKLLEEYGARGIDADVLAHAVTRRGMPAWRAIVDHFGADVLQFNGRIDRQRLGVRVFGDSDQLKELEAIVHPAVGALTKEILRETQEPVVVLEAIKLVEAGLHLWCDALWVVTCAPEVQIERVMRARHMRAEDARARLETQGSLDEKLRLANVVIDNSGSELDTRSQVARAWDEIRLDAASDKRAWLFDLPRAEPALEVVVEQSAAPPTQIEPTPAPVTETVTPSAITPQTPIKVRRARRTDLDALAVALAKRDHLTEPLSHEQVIARFGRRGYRIALANQRIIALAAWEAENLVAIVREVWAESPEAAVLALPKLFAVIEQDAYALVCEVVLLLIETDASPFVAEQAGASAYQPRGLNELHKVWRQVAEDRLQPDDQIWIKPLREELITQPV